MSSRPNPEWHGHLHRPSSPSSWSFSEISSTTSGNQPGRHPRRPSTYVGQQTVQVPQSRQFISSSATDNRFSDQANPIARLDLDLFAPNAQFDDNSSFDQSTAGVGSRFVDDIPNVVVTNTDSLELEDTSHELRLQPFTLDADLDDLYSPERFEQHFPYIPPRRLSQSQSEPPTYLGHWRDSNEQPESVVADPYPFPSSLTEPPQAAQEFVFNPMTGERQKETRKTRKKKATADQCHNRKAIRRRGGACVSCKITKRRCNLKHFDLPAALQGLQLQSSQASETTFSGSSQACEDDNAAGFSTAF